jgi:hypothetical protein
MPRQNLIDVFLHIKMITVSSVSSKLLKPLLDLVNKLSKGNSHKRKFGYIFQFASVSQMLQLPYAYIAEKHATQANPQTRIGLALVVRYCDQEMTHPWNQTD